MLAGREEHPLEPDAVLLLLAAPRLEGASRGTKLLGERVPEQLELGEPEDPRTLTVSGGIGRTDLRAAVRKRGDLDVAQIALQPGDLLRERAASRTLPGLGLRCECRGRPHITIRLGEVEQRHLRVRA
ncbi:MAG: hypothetical protein H0V81_14595 [Solirubrobacterales bacterium]|nr:hypothetical protein [Solirubrobacterales bacterium]